MLPVQGSRDSFAQMLDLDLALITSYLSTATESVLRSNHHPPFIMCSVHEPCATTPLAPAYVVVRVRRVGCGDGGSARKIIPENAL